MEKQPYSHPGGVIRRLRKEKGLTQTALCGEEISRNLLSQIESGKVRPSLRTMTYLAERLEVPVSLFFLSDDQRAVLWESELFSQILGAWEESRYEDCIALCGRLEVPSQRVRYLQAESYYRCGYERYLQGALGKACGYFRMAAEKQTEHPAAARAAEQMLARIALIVQEDPLTSLCYGDPLTETRETALLAFAAACVRNGTLDGIPEAILPLEYTDRNARCLALAMLYEARGQDSECRSAQIGIKEKELDPGSALYYYRSAEECCARMYDYETAYKMAKKRVNLLEKLRKSMEREREETK